MCHGTARRTKEWKWVSQRYAKPITTPIPRAGPRHGVLGSGMPGQGQGGSRLRCHDGRSAPLNRDGGDTVVTVADQLTQLQNKQKYLQNHLCRRYFPWDICSYSFLYLNHYSNIPQIFTCSMHIYCTWYCAKYVWLGLIPTSAFINRSEKCYCGAAVKHKWPAYTAPVNIL